MPHSAAEDCGVDLHSTVKGYSARGHHSDRAEPHHTVAFSAEFARTPLSLVL